MCWKSVKTHYTEDSGVHGSDETNWTQSSVPDISGPSHLNRRMTIQVWPPKPTVLTLLNNMKLLFMNMKIWSSLDLFKEGSETHKRWIDGQTETVSIICTRIVPIRTESTKWV